MVPGIAGRYLQQICGAAASVRAGIPHPFRCVRQQRFSCYHTRFYHIPKHTLWAFGRAITPPFYHPPSFITHTPNTPCGCSDVLSHPLVCHTSLGPPASCTSSPGAHNISHPPQDTTPGDNISNPKISSPGCVIWCQLRYTRMYAAFRASAAQAAAINSCM